MSPTNHSCANQLRHMIYYNLDLNLLDNALFLANRLLAYEPRTSEAIYLVGLCNLRLHRYKLAYECSKSSGTRSNHLGCAYVFAQACLNIGKYGEGVMALERLRSHWRGKNSWGKHTDSRRQALPDASAVFYLLGQLCRGNDDYNKASEYFSECLKLNPFMWEAFSALCDLGVHVRTSKIFVLNQDMLNGMESAEHSNHQEDPIPSLAVPSMTIDPFMVSTSKANVESRNGVGKTTLAEKLNGVVTNSTVPIINDGFETPPSSFNTIPPKDSTANNNDADIGEPPQAPSRRNKAILGNGMLGTDVGVHPLPRSKPSVPRLRKLANETEEGEGSGTGIIADRKRTVSGHAATTSSNGLSQGTQSTVDNTATAARRSVRILNSTTSRPNSRLAGAPPAIPRDLRELRRVKATNIKGRTNGNTVGRIVSGNRKHEPLDVDAKESRPHLSSIQPASKPAVIVNEKNKEIESTQMLLEVFRCLANGYWLLSQYRCQDAITVFNNLPQAQRDTPWVLAQIGRAHLEQSSWAEAEKYYSKVRSLAPARVDDLEYYSTVLWHLKRDVELSFLAHEIMDLDRLSPQAWCIIGNSLSLQRDHEGALKCFKRATQLDPKFAYAYTLQGHEHIASEEYDRALEAYRLAVAADKRHYNAWYGLGMVYEKQGKYDVAETHYRVALSINPTNAILVICIGWVLEKMKKLTVALGFYSKASELAQRSSLARYKKARALISMGENTRALEELLILKDIVPEEANVHFLLGKVYKTLNDKGKAVKHFTSALNLDPKVSYKAI